MERPLHSSGATWLDMPPDTIGTISTFLDVGSDLESLVVVAGPVHAGVIRRAYLWRNFRFLRSYDSLRSHALLQNSTIVRLQYKFRQWMEVNDNWKSMYSDDPPLSMSTGDHYDVTLSHGQSGMIRLRGLRRDVAFVDYMRFRDGRKTRCEEAKLIHSVGDLIVAVDGQSTIGMSASLVHKMLDGTIFHETVTLRFVEISDESFTRCLFSDPVVATDLGLVEVLRFLVEEKGVDVNVQSWSRKSLLELAIKHPDPSMFEYLVSVEGIEHSCMMLRDGSCGLRFWKYAAMDPEIEISRLKALIQQGVVDVNIRACDFSGRSLLHNLALRVARIKLLLDGGADPNARDNSGQTALDLVREDLSSHTHNNAIALLEEAMAGN